MTEEITVKIETFDREETMRRLMNVFNGREITHWEVTREGYKD